MAGELLIYIIGFFKWVFKGCKTKLSEEISGDENYKYSLNYIIGVIIFFSVITLCIFLLRIL